MPTSSPALPETPKEGLQHYIHELETLYYPWYATAAQRHFYAWIFLQIVAVSSGLVAALVAALANAQQLVGVGTVRLLLVVLPLLGSMASAVLVQTRVRDLMALREQGRQRVQHLIETAMVKFASAASPSDFTEIHSSLVDQLAEIESDQSRQFYRIVPKQIAIGRHGPSSPNKKLGA